MPRGFDTKLQLRLSPHLLERLNRAAQQKTQQSPPGVTITKSDIVRELLEKHLSADEKGET